LIVPTIGKGEVSLSACRKRCPAVMDPADKEGERSFMVFSTKMTIMTEENKQ
jgi:hypothetical protein